MAKDEKIMRPSGGSGGGRWARENQKPQNRDASKGNYHGCNAH